MTMKISRIFFSILLFCLFVSCGTKKETEQNQTVVRQHETEVKTAVIHLDSYGFLSKVANYKSEPREWKYLGDKPAIVDFYADWCGPCRAIAPTVEELARKYEGQLYVYKVDIDKEQELASDFGIRSIPTLLFIPLEGDPQVVSGALSKAEFEEIIDDFLLKKQ